MPTKRPLMLLLPAQMLSINRYLDIQIMWLQPWEISVKFNANCVMELQTPAGGADEPDALQQRRDMLHRKLETLQQRQCRRSDNLTEKFQRGLSVRRQ